MTLQGGSQTLQVLAPCDDGVVRSGRAEVPCRKAAEPWVLAATILLGVGGFALASAGCVRSAADEAFLSGFRGVMLTASMLALLASLSAAGMIRERP